MELSDDVLAAQAGDLAAYGRLIAATQAMVFAVVQRVLGERADAADHRVENVHASHPRTAAACAGIARKHVKQLGLPCLPPWCLHYPALDRHGR